MRLMHMGKEVYFLTEPLRRTLGLAICLSFLPLPVSSTTGGTGEKSTSAWRRCGGVTTNRHATITEFVDVIVQINPLPKIKKILFSARHSRWRR